MQAKRRTIHSSLFRAVVVELDALILSSSQGYPTRDQDKTIPLIRWSVSALQHPFENQLTSSLDIDSLESTTKRKENYIAGRVHSNYSTRYTPCTPCALQFSCIDLKIASRRDLREQIPLATEKRPSLISSQRRE